VAQSSSARVGINVQKYADGALTLMAFSVVPDLAGSALSINSAKNRQPQGACDAIRRRLVAQRLVPRLRRRVRGLQPLRPRFRRQPGPGAARHPDEVEHLGGLGWGFHLFGDVRLIPIFNFSLGHVESDSSLAGRAINVFTGKDIEFLKNGRLNAYGLGGSVILDYSRFREMYSVEVQLGQVLAADLLQPVGA
jgi:hypothetical protein